MSEIGKCPKCSGEMEKGYLDGAWVWRKGENYFQIGRGKRIWAYRCKNCGYVELYVEK